MRGPKTAAARRIAAGVMGLMMLAAVLFSSLYIAVEADHDCTGEDCPVCACVRQCENTLRSAGEGFRACPAVLIPFLSVLSAAALSLAAASFATPVSRKVRLNN